MILDIDYCNYIFLEYCGQTARLGMAEIALLLVIKKIGIALATDTVKFVEKKAGQVAALPRNMRLIQNDLELMRAFLKDISTKGCTDQVTETWIVQARRLAYDMEDIVDQFIYVVGEHHLEKSRWDLLKNVGKNPQSLFTLDEIATAVNRINEQLAQHKANKDWTKPIPAVSVVPAASHDRQQQPDIPGHSWVSPVFSIYNWIFFLMKEMWQSFFLRFKKKISISDDKLVGFDNNRKTLKKLLNLEESSQLQIIAVWGMGGVGKSTLVNSVFKNHASDFECHAWVSVSQSYILDDIWRSMLNGIYSKDKKQFDTEKMNSAELLSELKGILETKRYLIILDDVWRAADIYKIKKVLADKGNGSRVIITTRIEEVASIAHGDSKIKMVPLDEKDAWLLFCRTAFPQTENPICPIQLHECGKSIVEKCGGLPLAIVAIGSILCLKENNVTEWNLFYGQLIWELHNNENLTHVERILNLSYKYLPNYLQCCFLYCAMFPEDHMIHRKRLIRLWIAEGFIEQTGVCSLEQVAEGYLKELVRRSMLHVVEENSFGRIRCVRMHDLVRELAIYRSKSESFSITYDDTHGMMTEMLDSRRVSVLQCRNDIRSSIDPFRLRTFIGFNTSGDSFLSFLSTAKYLAVLELSGLPINDIPDSFGGLFNLRYLGLDKTKVKVLPKFITKLRNLVTLSLRDVNCLNFPPGSNKLKTLRHILMYKWQGEMSLFFESYKSLEPFDGLCSFKGLQTLDAVRASDVFIANLGNLSQLRTLVITAVKSIHCQQLCASLSEMHHLSLLEIRAINEEEVLQLENLTLSNSLKKLCFVGRFSEGTLDSPFFSENGYALNRISLIWSQLARNPVSRLSELSNLTEIWLVKAYTGKELIFHPNLFQDVKIIYLADLPQVNRVCIHEGSLLRLENLSIIRLVKLRDIPTGLEDLNSLEELRCITMHPDFIRNLQKANLGHVQRVYYTIRS